MHINKLAQTYPITELSIVNNNLIHTKNNNKTPPDSNENNAIAGQFANLSIHFLSFDITLSFFITRK
jgi:hypothetical protein